MIYSTMFCSFKGPKSKSKLDARSLLLNKQMKKSEKRVKNVAVKRYSQTNCLAGYFSQFVGYF